MDCLIKHSLSFVIDSVVKALVENANNFSHLLTTDDWKLLVDLYNAVDNGRICENQCLGCLEFARNIGMFSNFINGIASANKDYNNLLNQLRDIFKIEDAHDYVSLAIDLASSPDYVKSKISPESFATYDKYVDTVKGEISRLAVDHFMHEQAKCLDTISLYENLIEEQIICYNVIDRNYDADLFYVDQNVISRYANDDNFNRQIENFKERTGCQFVYSPYLIEDGIKMSRVRLAEYLDYVEKMMDGTMLIRSDEVVALAKEDIQVTVDRVLLWRNATRASEDLHVYKMHLNKWMYPHFSRSSRLSRCANDDIGKFLESFRPYMADTGRDFDLNGCQNDRDLYLMLYAHTLERSFSFQELVDGTIKHENDAECMKHINDLCDFLDLINYKTESLADHNKIRSSLRDAEHLKCAWKANYFVTDDKRLRTRGDLIYSLLGLSTKCISVADLKSKMVSEFKSL